MKKILNYNIFLYIVFLSFSVLFVWLVTNRSSFSSSILGDVNGNGKVDVADYIIIRSSLLGTKTLNDNEKKLADVNEDGKISSSDYIMIRKIILGISSTKETKETYKSGIALYDSKLNPYSYIVYDKNVLEFGADPTGEKDSTGAFISAIHAVFNTVYPNLDLYNSTEITNKGGVVFVPKGKYRIDGQIVLPTNIGLFGELKEGSTDGTILLMNTRESQIIANTHSSVQNMAFYYPNQKISNGKASISYPPTIVYGPAGSEGITLDNINFVNSYDAISAQGSTVRNTSIVIARNIYGTPLHIGILNDTNYDTLRLENINFSKKYWLNSSLGNKPSDKELSNALKNYATAIQLQHVDWYYLTDININGYNKGTELITSTVNKGVSEGEFYNYNTSNCKYGIYSKSNKHMAITNSKITATDTGLYIGNGYSEADVSINSSKIESSGFAISSENDSHISISNSTINGKINKNSVAKIVFVNDTLNNTGYTSTNISGLNNIKSTSYNKKVTIKPKTTNLEVIYANNDEDITSKLKSAVDKLASSGGTIYIPAGTYNLSGSINVKSGIEIRGSTPWLQNNSLAGGTVLKTNFKSSPSFVLNKNSGINGIEIQYPLTYSVNSQDKVAAIKGNGSNIYVVNTMILNSYIGIDFATSRCDNHYVDRVYGVFLSKGVTVGSGSSNGIIRDCHFHTNVVLSNSELVNYIRNNETAFDINNSTNEIVFNNFSWGPNIGMSFNNAKSFFAISNGIDQGNNSVNVSSSTGQLVSNMLVATSDNNNSLYLNTNSGNIDLINNMYWGNNAGSAFNINGSSNISFFGGIINHASNLFRNNQGNISMYGFIIRPVIDIPLSKKEANVCYNC